MIISTIVASAALMSPADVAENITQPTEPVASNARMSKLEDGTKMGVSVSYTTSYVPGSRGLNSQGTDDANTWD